MAKWLLGIYLLMVSCFAIANTIPSTNKTVYTCSVIGATSGVGDTAAQACVAVVVPDVARFNIGGYYYLKSTTLSVVSCSGSCNLTATLVYTPVYVAGIGTGPAQPNGTQTGITGSIGPVTTPVCPLGYSLSADKLTCSNSCTTDQRTSTGSYAVGGDPAGFPPLVACSNGCRVTGMFSSTTPQSALVAGVRTYYVAGSYYMTGDSCVPGDGGIQTQATPSVDSIPKDTCGALQGKASMNGKTVCVDQKGSDGVMSDDSKGKATTTTSSTTVTNADGSKTKTDVTTNVGADGSKSVTTTKTTTMPDGSTSSSSTTLTDPKKDAPDESACQQNPSSAGCGGVPAVFNGLYTAKGATIKDSFSRNSSALASSPIGTVVGSFFRVSGGGSCPTWSAAIPFLKTTLTIDQFCTPFAVNAFVLLRAAVLLACAFFAFRVAVDN